MPASRPGVPACVRSGLAGPDHGEGSRPGCRWHGKELSLARAQKYFCPRRQLRRWPGRSSTLRVLGGYVRRIGDVGGVRSGDRNPQRHSDFHARRSLDAALRAHGSHPGARSPAQATSRRRPSSAASRPARSWLRSAHRPDARSVRRLCTARCSASADSGADRHAAAAAYSVIPRWRWIVMMGLLGWAMGTGRVAQQLVVGGDRGQRPGVGRWLGFKPQSRDRQPAPERRHGPRRRRGRSRGCFYDLSSGRRSSDGRAVRVRQLEESRLLARLGREARTAERAPCVRRGSSR
jgi:hypothetical protein